MTYNVKFTDSRKEPIVIEDTDVDTSLGISLYGRNALSYGQDLQESVLHILESFSAPEDLNNQNTPDLTKISDNAFTGLIEGHLWFNSTQDTLNYYDGIHWQPLSNRDDIAINRGSIADGMSLPKPMSKITGKVFDYDECVWIVSPSSLPQVVDGFVCNTDDNALVNMKYKSGSIQISGIANYMIVGLSGNRNQRQQTLFYNISNAATGVALPASSVLSSQCIPLINGNLSGMSCDGATSGCGVGNCAPRTGINFNLTVSGGTGPYTARLINIARSTTNTACVSVGYDSTSNKIHTNTASMNVNVLLGTSNNVTFGPLSLLGDCGTDATPLNGTLTIQLEDSVGDIRNIIVPYVSERLYPTNSINDAPYNTTVVTGSPSVQNLASIGSPNYLYVQDNLLSAPANSSFYMTRNFNIPNSGTYTMKIFADDNVFVYVDGNLIYSGNGPLATSVNPPATVQLNLTAGAHQFLLGYENVPANTPSYIAFSIYDPSNNIFYTSNKSGWLALTATTGIQN